MTDLVKLCEGILMAPYRGGCAREFDQVPCPSPRGCGCEDGLIEYLVAGSENKTETGTCSCARGQERQAEHDGDLESLGADKYDRLQRGEHP